MDTPDGRLDLDRMERLSTKIIEAIKDHYDQGSVSRDRVCEVLNTLAFVSAWTISSCDDPEALEFFSKALNLNLRRF